MSPSDDAHCARFTAVFVFLSVCVFVFQTLPSPKSSSDDAIEHLADKKRIQKVESELQGFEMTTQLDKNLLLGVLKH